MGREDYCINIVLDIFNPLIVVIEAPNNAKSISGSVLTEETELAILYLCELAVCPLVKPVLGAAAWKSLSSQKKASRGRRPQLGC